MPPTKIPTLKLFQKSQPEPYWYTKYVDVNIRLWRTGPNATFGQSNTVTFNTPNPITVNLATNKGLTLLGIAITQHSYAADTSLAQPLWTSMPFVSARANLRDASGQILQGNIAQVSGPAVFSQNSQYVFTNLYYTPIRIEKVAVIEIVEIITQNPNGQINNGTNSTLNFGLAINLEP